MTPISATSAFASKLEILTVPDASLMMVVDEVSQRRNGSQHWYIYNADSQGVEWIWPLTMVCILLLVKKLFNWWEGRF